MQLFLTNWLLATALHFVCESLPVTANATLRGSGSTKLQLHNRILEEEETGTFLIASIEYSDNAGPVDRPEHTLNIELENGLVYILTNANPSWLNGKGKFLKSGVSKIKIGKGATIAGAKVDLHGGAPEDVTSLFGRNLVEGDNRRKLAVAGTRSVLAVRVVAADGQYSSDEAFLSNKVFGTSGDTVNLVSQYQACSFNQLNFVKAENPLVNNGVVTITVATNLAEGDGVMVNAITNAINSQFGVSRPDQIANHVMYCLPDATMSGIAYAYINSWNSVYSNQWCNYVSRQMHEIGHNLNFAHSNEVNPYNDQSGMMGYSYSNDDGPKMCFNSAKSFQTGWYPTKTVTPVTADCGGFDGRVYGLSDFDGLVGGQRTTVVKINNSQSGQDDFFVNYNKKTGVNSGTVEGGNQVMITSAGKEGTGYAESELRAKLSPGGNYTIANFEGTGKEVTIIFESIDTTVSPNPGRVVITYDGMVCGSSTLKPVTASPTKAPVTSSPTMRPTNTPPSTSPTLFPTNAPVTVSPTTRPTIPPPTKKPTSFPTMAPVTAAPTQPCWATGTACKQNGNNCCKGCFQSKCK